jgi:hypothetical protein
MVHSFSQDRPLLLAHVIIAMLLLVMHIVFSWIENVEPIVDLVGSYSCWFHRLNL